MRNISNINFKKLLKATILLGLLLATLLALGCSNNKTQDAEFVTGVLESIHKTKSLDEEAISYFYVRLTDGELVNVPIRNYDGIMFMKTKKVILERTMISRRFTKVGSYRFVRYVNEIYNKPVNNRQLKLAGRY